MDMPHSGTVMQLSVDELVVLGNIRSSFDQEFIDRLAVSIQARGIHLPLRVRWDAGRQSWAVVSGENRLRAARLAGLATVPCLAIEGELSEEDILCDQIVENTVRNDISPLDYARALQKLKALKRCSSRDLALGLGLSPAAITRAESLLSLPEDIQKLVDSGQVPESTAYLISRLPDTDAQRQLALDVAAKRLNREQVADFVQTRIGRKQIRPKAARLACRLDGGIAVSISSGEALDWESLLAALDRLRRAAKRLSENGEEITALAKACKPSAF